jgi:hypothetical protein
MRPGFQHLGLFIPALWRKRSGILRFAQNDKLLSKKTRIETSIRVLKCYPADAVQADHPFPFSNGWMTVAAASDFQSRPAILCGRPSLLVLSNSGSGITPRNLEHRRVNHEPLVES